MTSDKSFTATVSAKRLVTLEMRTAGSVIGAYYKCRMRHTLALMLCFTACAPQPEPPKPPITVFTAASLARPFSTLSDSFRAQSGVLARAELGGSLEHVRKLTELGRIPDALMLVDDDVIAGLLPSYVDW